MFTFMPPSDVQLASLVLNAIIAGVGLAEADPRDGGATSRCCRRSPRAAAPWSSARSSRSPRAWPSGPLPSNWSTSGFVGLELVVEPGVVEDRVLPVERRVGEHRGGDAAAHVVRAHAGDVRRSPRSSRRPRPRRSVGHFSAKLLATSNCADIVTQSSHDERGLVGARVPVDGADRGAGRHRDLLARLAPPRHASAARACGDRIAVVGARRQRERQDNQQSDDRQPAHPLSPTSWRRDATRLHRTAPDLSFSAGKFR